MPKDIEYHIGDYVQHENLGEAIILGSHLHHEKGHPVYHVYFFRDKLFRYAFARHLTFTSAATPETIEKAREILISATQIAKAKYQYKQGDIVSTPLSNVLILDNGRKRTNGRVYYHVAREADDSVHYMDTMDIFRKIDSASAESVRRAKKILMDKVLYPAFSDDEV